MTQNDPIQALGFLSAKDAIVSNTELLVRYHLLRARALEQTGQRLTAASERAAVDSFLDGAERESNRRRLWSNLAEQTIADLNLALGGQNVVVNGWIELAVIAKRFITDAVIFERAITDWEIRYVDPPGFGNYRPGAFDRESPRHYTTGTHRFVITAGRVVC